MKLFKAHAFVFDICSVTFSGDSGPSIKLCGTFFEIRKAEMKRRQFAIFASYYNLHFVPFMGGCMEKIIYNIFQTEIPQSIPISGHLVIVNTGFCKTFHNKFIVTRMFHSDILLIRSSPLSILLVNRIDRFSRFSHEYFANFMYYSMINKETSTSMKYVAVVARQQMIYRFHLCWSPKYFGITVR